RPVEFGACSGSASRLLSVVGPHTLPLRVEVGLGDEADTEAMERAEQGVDLVERVLPASPRLHAELQEDLVVAVADPQPQPRLGDSASHSSPGRVLDEHTHEGAAVELRPVEERPLVEADAASRSASQEGTPRRVLQQVGHASLLRVSAYGRGCAERIY